MGLTSSIRNIENPDFYFELGKLISSSGNEHFAGNMLDLVDKLVPVNLVDLSEWTIDERQASLLDIKCLGSAGLKEERSAAPASPPQDDHPLLKKMIEMDDSLLIQMNGQTDSPFARDTFHQCSLVSRKANRRCVISFYRLPTQRVFSLSELSFLKSLSETLLPLMERHAQLSRQHTLKARAKRGKGSVTVLRQTRVQREFHERLSLRDVTLSAREKEVCLGLLTGGTVPEMAERLSVKNSSVETYLKRAAAKLGVSGRHGLAKWMVGM